MAQEARPIDARSLPDVARLVHEVNQTGRPQLIQVGGEAARLSPARPRRRTGKVTTREEMLQVFAETHGAWNGLVDPDEFKRERERLQVDDREPRTL